MFVTAWIGPDFARDLGLVSGHSFNSLNRLIDLLINDQSGSGQVRACVYSSFGKERRDGQGQPEDTTIITTITTYARRRGTVPEFGREHGPRIQSQYSHVFFLTSARRDEARRGENKSGGEGRDWPWPRMRVDPWQGKKKTKKRVVKKTRKKGRIVYEKSFV